MTKRKSLNEMFQESGLELPSGSEPRRLGSVQDEVPPHLDIESEAVLQSELSFTSAEVRQAAIARMPEGVAILIRDMLPRLGVILPDPVVPEGATLEEAIASDLNLLNLVIGRVVANLQVHGQLTETLAKVDEVMGDRLSQVLIQQRRQAEERQFQGAMAAIVGGDPRGTFQFPVARSYQAPAGWEKFAIPAIETTALPEGL